jgi:putative DNA primase/helicase
MTATTTPAATMFTSVPDDLKELNQAVLWKYVTRDGKTTKVPYQINGKPASTSDPATWGVHEDVLAAYQRFPNHYSGIGFVFSVDDPYCGIDLDNCIDDTGELKPWAQPIIATFGDTYMEVSPSRHGIKIWCKATLPGAGRSKKDEAGEGIEVYDRGRYFTVTGNAFNGAPSQIEDHQKDVEKLYALVAGPQTGKVQPINGKIPHGQQHTTLVSLAGTMRRRGMGAEAIFAALWETNTSQCEVPGPAENIRRIAESACRNWQPDPSANAFRGQPDAGADAAPQAPNLLAGIHRDYGNGERLIAMYGAELRYCHAFKKWLWFDGQRWRVDECGHARDFAKLTAVEFLRQAVEAGLEAAQKFAKESLDSKRLNNMLLEAQSGLSIGPADLDTHPYLLNFNNGTVDLKDGRLYPHERGQFITKMVKYAYRPAATCPTFLRFLERIMGITPDATEGQLQRAERLIEYLQKAIGYSLTGTTCEKAVFLLYGPGDNGKSTLLALFLHLLEEYAVLLQIDSLMVRQESNNTQADLADLRGARFVMTSETEEGQRLAEGKLKRITQGMGRIKAVRKYENPVEFNESHKLWIDANHLPQVRGTDNAIWNRLHPVPFTVTIPKAEQDRDLRSKLLAEAEGILAWAVAGAVRWHREGLGKPPEVEQAGAAWRTESDQTGRFLEACCIVGEFASVTARVLYQTYRKWCDEVGERAQPENICFKRLGEQGFKSRHTMKGNTYDGVGLLTDHEGNEGNEGNSSKLISPRV